MPMDKKHTCGRANCDNPVKPMRTYCSQECARKANNTVAMTRRKQS